MYQSYMNVSKFHSTPSLKATSKKQAQVQQEKPLDNKQNFVKVPLSSYIANNNIRFGSKIEELKELDASKLPQDKFDSDECSCDGGYNVSCITNLASHYITEQIRHILHTGELVPYKKEQIINENKYYCTKDEIQEKLEEAKEYFLNYFNEEAQRATDEINKLSPTKTEHTVYRIVDEHVGENEYYFDELSSFEKGDETVLDVAPLYVGSDPEYLLKSYSNKNKPQRKVLFKIDLPVGSKLAKLPSSDGINQLLMKPSSRFKIIDNQEFQNNFRLISLEYIPE